MPPLLLSTQTNQNQFQTTSLWTRVCTTPILCTIFSDDSRTQAMTFRKVAPLIASKKVATSITKWNEVSHELRSGPNNSQQPAMVIIFLKGIGAWQSSSKQSSFYLGCSCSRLCRIQSTYDRWPRQGHASRKSARRRCGCRVLHFRVYDLLPVFEATQVARPAQKTCQGI